MLIPPDVGGTDFPGYDPPRGSATAWSFHLMALCTKPLTQNNQAMH
ncbi:MAG TPA: hypothetical protein VMY59_05120 [Candidatus Thermoplasmatota archaeon]|nr:hypothetical protein [Candidatus Thermoplasmatota archaeon]